MTGYERTSEDEVEERGAPPVVQGLDTPTAR